MTSTEVLIHIRGDWFFTLTEIGSNNCPVGAQEEGFQEALQCDGTMVEGVRLKVERCKSIPAAPKTRAPKVMGSSPQERTGPAPKVRFPMLGFALHFSQDHGCKSPRGHRAWSQGVFLVSGVLLCSEECSVKPLCLERFPFLNLTPMTLHSSPLVFNWHNRSHQV